MTRTAFESDYTGFTADGAQYLVDKLPHVMLTGMCVCVCVCVCIQVSTHDADRCGVYVYVCTAKVCLGVMHR